jgi:hypothetical protein
VFTVGTHSSIAAASSTFVSSFHICNKSPHISFVLDYLGELLRGERSATSSSSSYSFML